jgi:hypothetical protein
MLTADIRALAGTVVQDMEGAPVTFVSAWADQPVIFVFLRHFG